MFKTAACTPALERKNKDCSQPPRAVTGPRAMTYTTHQAPVPALTAGTQELDRYTSRQEVIRRLLLDTQ